MGKVCLAMVVANERPVIERCLNSVKHLIDQVCISINEDKDGTQECIEEWGKVNEIPTTVWFDPWNGYGPNKTRNLLKIKTELETEYILFLDADEVFVTDPADVLSYPSEQDRERLWTELDSKPDTDVFYMKTHYGNFIYDRWQIIRNNQVWIWHLPYQEFLRGEKSNRKANISWLYNRARHEGHSSRHPDLPQNLERLEKWVLENPESPNLMRAAFYLGQGYKDNRNYPKAIEHLEKRLKLGGWNQERYIAALYLAQIYKSQANHQKRRKSLLKCIELDPRRLEAYYELMQDDFKTNKRQALAWALMAPNTRIPPSDGFLINKKLYEYEFDYYLSIIAYYAAIKKNPDDFVDTGVFQIGLDAINRCVDKLPESQKQRTISNTRFYTDNLPKLVSFTPTNNYENRMVMVIEDFYDDPYRIRNIALNMPFGVKGNYPGARTESYIEDGMKERIENIVGDKITYWPSQYNGSFQYTIANHKSWIHRDNTEWSLVVYLTPDAPVDGGTKLYIHKPTGISKTDDKAMDELLNKDSHDHNAWHMVDKIGNRFNRAVLFKGRNSHMSDQYFGTCLEDGRLFQTFFFNTASFTNPPKTELRSGTTSTVTVEKNKGYVVKKILKYHSYNVLEREVHWLKYFNNKGYEWCPKFIATDSVAKSVTMEYVGEPITKANAPSDWREQLKAILQTLESEDIQHNDIKNKEVLVKDGKLYLIDYGWVTQGSDDWSCGGTLCNKPKPWHEFFDNEAMSRIEAFLTV